MIRIPLKVKANLLTQEELVTIASGSSNSIKVKFDIDPNSDFADSTLQKRAIFRYYQGSYFISDVDVNGEVYVPKFVIAYPYFKVALRAESENATAVVTTNEIQVPVEKSPVFYETTITDGDVTIRNLDGALNIYKAGDVTFIDFTTSYKTAVDAVIAGTYATASALNLVASDVDSIKEDIINMSNSISDLQGDIQDLDTTKADKANVYTKGETEARLAEKQDTLVSGENIKTLNGTSLLGSGNYDFDTALNENSTNAVQNKVITEYITDLESKVSTLAVKVYNHDIALGTLNIENTLYSVENADSFAIPTTIGTNADVVIPKSRMALSAIKGKTEYSRNLINVDNGTIITSGNYSIPMALPAGTYTISASVKCTDLGTDGKYQGWIRMTDANDNRMINTNLVTTLHTFTSVGETITVNKTFTISEPSVRDTSFIDFGRYTVGGASVEINHVMLSRGSTALPYVPYYTGLKNVELNSLNVYGESDEYKAFALNDIVVGIHIGKLASSNTTCVYLENENGDAFRIIANSNTSFSLQKMSNWENYVIGGLGDYRLADLGAGTQFKVTQLGYSNYIFNATSVKSILPSSILPKTLAEYERLEVVDNGDDTYKIDLVSHAELHVGDEINSLWVGNPQSENYIVTDNTHIGFTATFADQSSENFLAWYGYLPDSTLGQARYNRLFPTQNQLWNYFAQSDLVANNSDFSSPLFGGSDKFEQGVNTNRNVVMEFTKKATITAISSNPYFNSDFRNGEETRTTLIDNLSLDDVSAVIDTGSIVYADNSNAEYDVSIAETSVELLVNKN
jgi:hypothetical protein